MKPSFATILQAASDLTGVRVEYMKGKNRERQVIHARAAALVVARSYTEPFYQNGYSYPSLAAHLEMDHSSLVYAVENFPIYCRRDPRLADLPDRIRSLAEGRTPEPAPLPKLFKPKKREPKTYSSPREKALAGYVSKVENERRLIAKTTGKVKPKNDFTPEADHDDGHLFHANVAAKNDAFLAALRGS